MLRSIWILLLLIVTLVFAGCGSKAAPEAKAPVPATMGMIDMQKAVQGHPKYQQVMALQQEYDSMAAKLESELRQSREVTLPSTSDVLASQEGMEQVHKNLEQEFNSKMAAKQEELNQGLAEKSQGIQAQLAEEFRSYNEAVDEEYNPQLFNLQLKLKTVQVSKEEADLLQKQMDALQQERGEKLNRKHQELAKRMEEQMAPAKAEAQKSMERYSQELNNQLSQKAAEKNQEMTARSLPSIMATKEPSPEAQQQLVAKRQEIEALQQYIVENIRTQVASIAVAKGLETVITKVLVNVNAVDITDEVIAQCNK